MNLTVKTNFGSIHGRRVVTFKVTNDGKVLPAKLRKWNDPESLAFFDEEGAFITAHESFRRWKAARKAWRTRKAKQLTLPL